MRKGVEKAVAFSIQKHCNEDDGNRQKRPKKHHDMGLPFVFVFLLPGSVGDCVLIHHTGLSAL